MYLMCHTLVDNKDYVCLMQFPEMEDVEEAAPDHLDMKQFLSRQVYLTLMRSGIRQSIYVHWIEWDDEELLEFLADSGQYRVYQGDMNGF